MVISRLRETIAKWVVMTILVAQFFAEWRHLHWQN